MATTRKELKKMTRLELIDLIYEQKKLELELRERIDKLEEALEATPTGNNAMTEELGELIGRAESMIDSLNQSLRLAGAAPVGTTRKAVLQSLMTEEG